MEPELTKLASQITKTEKDKEGNEIKVSYFPPEINEIIAKHGGLKRPF